MTASVATIYVGGSQAATAGGQGYYAVFVPKDASFFDLALDGSHSTVGTGGTNLSYAWKKYNGTTALLGTDGNPIAANNATPTVRFAIPGGSSTGAHLYEIALTVTDDAGTPNVSAKTQVELTIDLMVVQPVTGLTAPALPTRSARLGPAARAIFSLANADIECWGDSHFTNGANYLWASFCKLLRTRWSAVVASAGSAGGVYPFQGLWAGASGSNWTRSIAAIDSSSANTGYTPAGTDGYALFDGPEFHGTGVNPATICGSNGGILVNRGTPLASNNGAPNGFAWPRDGNAQTWFMGGYGDSMRAWLVYLDGPTCPKITTTVSRRGRDGSSASGPAKTTPTGTLGWAATAPTDPISDEGAYDSAVGADSGLAYWNEHQLELAVNFDAQDATGTYLIPGRGVFQRVDLNGNPVTTGLTLDFVGRSGWNPSNWIGDGNSSRRAARLAALSTYMAAKQTAANRPKVQVIQVSNVNAPVSWTNVPTAADYQAQLATFAADLRAAHAAVSSGPLYQVLCVPWAFLGGATQPSGSYEALVAFQSLIESLASSLGVGFFSWFSALGTNPMETNVHVSGAAFGQLVAQALLSELERNAGGSGRNRFNRLVRC